MILLNFGHTITRQQMAAIENAAGSKFRKVHDVTVQFDLNQPFAEQAAALAEQVGLSSEEWQTMAVLINPPAHSLVALALFAELHGRMGYFPAIIRLKPVQNSIPPQFEFAEIVNLQAIRDQARMTR